MITKPTIKPPIVFDRGRSWTKLGLVLLLFSISSLLSQSKLGINETYFETLESKYYNQAIEIYNGSDIPVDLSLYFLIAGEVKMTSNVAVFTGSRTNEIVTWSDSKQTTLSSTFSNIVFTSLLPPGETAVILDNGYRFDEYFSLTNALRTNTVYLLTTSGGVLGTGNFMKKDDVLQLQSTLSGEVIDEFHNQDSPKGYGVVKIDPTKKGLADNTASRSQTIGYVEDLQDLYTLLPPDHIALDEVNGKVTIVGLPQVHNLTCRYLTVVSSLCNRTISFEKHDYIKMYHYPKGSANLITENDEIVFAAGQSSPITLFALEPGLHVISTADDSFPPLKKTISSFDHPQSSGVFITEIYYQTNKDLTWLEIYSSQAHSLPLTISTFNSDYKQNHEFDLGRVTLSSGYNVLGYRNQDFNRRFPLSDAIIEIPSQFAITAKGVIVLASEGRYLDIVHYDKNWFDDLIEGRSLQRIVIKDYAFAKSQWNVSTEVDSTPFTANVFTQNFDWNIDLISSRLPLSTLKIHFMADFNVGGTLTAYLYDNKGYRIGKVFSQEVSRSYQLPLFLCLKEVQSRFGLVSGEYSLMFLFSFSGGKKTLYRNFILE